MLQLRAHLPNGPCTSKTRCEGVNKVGSCSRQMGSSRVICRSSPSRAVHQAISAGATRLINEKVAAVPLMVISGRPLMAACHIPCATTSG